MLPIFIWNNLYDWGILIMEDLFKLFNVEAGFEYKLCGVREFFTENDFFDKKGFRSDKTVYDLITDKESYEEEIR